MWHSEAMNASTEYNTVVG